LAVIKDSNNPTTASAIEYGAMTWRVCKENGTLGSPRTGSASGSVPSSPTVGTWMPPAMAAIVRTTMATNGAGIAFVARGIV
jgi:hypothetical protein